MAPTRERHRHKDEQQCRDEQGQANKEVAAGSPAWYQRFMASVNGPTGKEAMEVLQSLLADTTLRSLKTARAITFWLDDEAWTLDPRQKPMVSAGATGTAALSIRTSPGALLRMLTEPDMYLGEQEVLAFEGDPLALKPLVDALRGGSRPLMTRLGAMSR
jgi:hypothetical protein